MGKKKGLVLGVILLLGIGFATVTTTLYINGNVNISANSEDFDVKFTKAVVDNENKTSTAISDDGKTLNFTTKELEALNDKSVLDFEITNNSSLYDAEVSIECTSGENGEYYQITKEITPTILAKTTETGKVEVEKIKKIAEDIEENITCTLNAVAKERTTKGEEPVKVLSNHIVDTGEKCFENKEAGSCAPGTEIRYMVNDTTEKTFYVLHDDGDTITLQQRENTVNGVAWYADGTDNIKGPLTALQALEDKTSDWSNVNTINYTMGTTAFNGNIYTGCNENLNCNINTYILGQRSAKARMITMQEALALGCTTTTNSCPIWMNNYLNGSTNNGGTVNGSDIGYWTMSADESYSYCAWRISVGGFVTSNNATFTYYGTRAVVEITK